MNNKWFGILSIIGIYIFLILIIIYTPTIHKYRNNGDLIINEVMASNKNTIIDSYGNKSDYIEIYNGYDYDVNLSGYYLSDDNFNTKKWKFPNVTIKSHEYLIVYASGLDKYDTELHTNFKLDSKGEVITLSKPDGKSISKIYYTNLLDDISYGYNGTKYVYYYNGTPGYSNDSLYENKSITYSKKDSKLKITEYMNNNVSAFKSASNKYYSVMELYNGYDTDINLSGYYLSNKYDNKYKYIFPDITIKSHEYLVVYLSGLDKYDTELHTNFKLDTKDNVLILSDNKKNEIDKIYIEALDSNVSSGLYNDKWYYYTKNSIGLENKSDYVTDIKVTKDLIVNEVSAYPYEAIEIKNISNNKINLSNYYIGDKRKRVKLPNITLNPNSFYVVYGSDYYSYSNNKLYTGFHINNTTEKIYIYNGEVVIDTYNVGKLNSYVSSGITDNKRVFYKNITLGKENSSVYYSGYTNTPIFNINGGYVENGTKIKISADGDIYYTLDGTFPTKNSTKYTGEITINKNTVIKAIAYKDGYIESDVISRTYIVGRHHDVAFVSISAPSNNLSSLLVNYRQEQEYKVSFEFYQEDGSLGTGFIGGIKLTGMDSREKSQKSMAIYLRKKYGVNSVTYPFFKDTETKTYSSFTLRNSGEDPLGIRIQDTVLTYALKGQMDIDMQGYRPVVVYLNGEYYGLYNMREKLNGDYIETNYGISDNFDLIKFGTANKGSTASYNNLINYIKTHNVRNKDVYEYLKTQIDMQELCNYMIVESYYGNTDMGNIRYWKSKNGKFRWMLYDLDWALWNTNLPISYTINYTKIPAVTYLPSTFLITRTLYQNGEFRDLYLSTLAYHMKNTFNPTRMSKIVDELASEIENEIPYHNKRWNVTTNWKSNVNYFKTKLNNRYYYVLRNIKSEFNLSDSEYNKYFGDIK